MSSINTSLGRIDLLLLPPIAEAFYSKLQNDLQAHFTGQIQFIGKLLSEIETLRQNINSREEYWAQHSGNPPSPLMPFNLEVPSLPQFFPLSAETPIDERIQLLKNRINFLVDTTPIHCSYALRKCNEKKSEFSAILATYPPIPRHHEMATQNAANRTAHSLGKLDPRKRRKTENPSLAGLIHCRYCTMLFTSFEEVRGHIRGQHPASQRGKNYYLCKVKGCKITLCSATTIIEHVRIHENSQELELKEPSELSLQAMVPQGRRPKSRPKNPNRQIFLNTHWHKDVFQCGNCLPVEHTCATFQDYIAHHKIEHHSEPHTCMECIEGKRKNASTDLSEFTDHLIRHLLRKKPFPEIAKAISCTFCNISFNSLDEVRSHKEMSHPKEADAAFGCKICTESSTLYLLKKPTPYEVMLHIIKTHGEKISTPQAAASTLTV